MAGERSGRSLYGARRAKELSISEVEITGRTPWDRPTLSANAKTGISLDLPLTSCVPTAACAEVCYASQGRQYFRASVVKSLAVSRLIDQDPERAARKIVDEAGGRAIRIAGSGEVLPTHRALLEHIDHHGGSWWGFTRRVDTHRVLPDLMFSIDATTPAPALDYVAAEVPVRRRAYLRRPQDGPAPLDVAVTFPVHGSITRYVEQVPRDPTDCPEIRGEVTGCWGCRRCY